MRTTRNRIVHVSFYGSILLTISASCPCAAPLILLPCPRTDPKVWQGRHSAQTSLEGEVLGRPPASPFSLLMYLNPGFLFNNPDKAALGSKLTLQSHSPLG